MTLTEFLVLLLVAGICGSLEQTMVGYSHGGCLVSIVLGFIGALLAEWLSCHGSARIVRGANRRPTVSECVVGDRRGFVCRGTGAAIRSAIVGCVKP